MASNTLKLANSQRWDANYGMGQNAFTACPPRSTAPNSQTAPAKRGPKKHSLTPEQRNAALMAFHPSSHSHNYAPVPAASKPVTTASRRFATA